MASAFSKSVFVGLGISLLVACGGEDPTPAPTTSGGSSGSGTVGGSGAGLGGSLGSSGSTTTAGGGAGGSGTAGGAMGGSASGAGGGQSQAGSAGAGGSGGSSGGAGGASSGGTGGAGMGGSGGMAPFLLTTPAFEHVEACSAQNTGACKVFPKMNVMTTIGGQNISPELDWAPGPEGTLSYVITLHDFTNGFTHWAIWNIPASTLKLSANLARDSKPAVPAGAQQKSFSTEDAGYMGPGKANDVYELRLYALKVATFTPKNTGDQGAIYDEISTDAGKIVLATSKVRGRSP